MDWQTVREKYPHRWVVIEAYDARTLGSERIIDQLEVVGMFNDKWKPAWEHYKQLHHMDKEREYYVVHTDRADLEIGVMDAFGRIVEDS
jgi:hypothetical protein